jgi:predicted nucleic acid-binding Zn ribbon protein
MAKRPRIPRPLPVKQIIQEILSPGERDALELRQTIRRVWEAVVPAPLLAHARLVELRRKELWVEVDGSAWSQELQFLKPRILQALARTLGPEKVSDLRLRVGGGDCERQ